MNTGKSNVKRKAVMRSALDLSLYLVTDSSMEPDRLLNVIAAAVRGGVTLVQLRRKQENTGDFIALGRAVRDLLKPAGVPLIINDRVDVALACKAEGVHLGQSDMEVPDARRLLGRDAVVGRTIDRDEQIAVACAQDVDYLGIGPIHATATKPDHSEPLGIEGFLRRRSLSHLPCVAIGSVTHEDAANLIRAGADGLAVVSAICSADSPELAARLLRDEVDFARS